MSKLFCFKQFSVDQTGCAMKINTDGVLLGALIQNEIPQTILDIGTGTGVVALMLAQSYPEAIIDAIDIDEQAATAARRNFFHSPFADRLTSYHSSYEDFFLQFPEKKYDLIVSNPPFFLNSLKNPDNKKTIARHANETFFQQLILFASAHLSHQGSLRMILPLDIVNLCKSLVSNYNLYPAEIISIYSSKIHLAHRNIISFTGQVKEVVMSDFFIYESDRQYTQQYQAALEPFFTIF